MREAYRDLMTSLYACGPVRIHPSKAKIGVRAETDFADLVLKKNWIDVQFVLSRKLAHPRLSWMGAVGSHRFRHYLRLERPSDVDEDVRGWMRESYTASCIETRGRRT